MFVFPKKFYRLHAMRRGVLERKIENVDTGDVLKRKRSDEEEGDDGDENETKEPPVSRQRRASILPGSLAYNEAILVSFDAVELAEKPQIDSGNGSEDESAKSESEPATYTVDEPPDDSVSDSSP